MSYNKEWRKQWYEKNKERISEYSKKWRLKKKEVKKSKLDEGSWEEQSNES